MKGFYICNYSIYIGAETKLHMIAVLEKTYLKEVNGSFSSEVHKCFDH